MMERKREKEEDKPAYFPDALPVISLDQTPTDINNSEQQILKKTYDFSSMEVIIVKLCCLTY